MPRAGQPGGDHLVRGRRALTHRQVLTEHQPAVVARTLGPGDQSGAVATLVLEQFAAGEALGVGTGRPLQSGIAGQGWQVRPEARRIRGGAKALGGTFAAVPWQQRGRGRDHGHDT